MITVAIFLTLVFLFSLVSKRAGKSIITGPMVFALAGILIFAFFSALDKAQIKDKTILVAGEITLAVVLFSDATRISLRRVMRESQLPARLLGIGMPLAIVLGALVAMLLFSDLSLWEAAILATILAPTDASLGIAVVSSKLVPARIRQALNVEGGLNDGLSVPLLMLFIGLSGIELRGGEQSWLAYTVQQIGLGLLVGVVIGWLGGFLMTRAEERDWIIDEAKQLALLSLAVLAWGIAEKMIGGNGFIAASVAGVMLALSYEQAKRHIAEFNEAWGDLLIYFVFFLFGMIAGPVIQMIGGALWLYALLSLSLVRMLPVAISMMGARLQPASVLFLGWFGPRGLASVVLGLIYLEQLADLPENATITLTVTATVLLSIFAHGASAVPLIKRYAHTVADIGPNAPEHAESAV
jgi:NhaP-type Na+/H+ or K+/H+ antiporter